MRRIQIRFSNRALRKQAFVPIEAGQRIVQVGFCQQKLAFGLQHLLGTRAAFDFQVVLIGRRHLSAGLGDGGFGSLHFQRITCLRLGNFGDIRRDIGLSLADIGLSGADIGLQISRILLDHHPARPGPLGLRGS